MRTPAHQHSAITPYLIYETSFNTDILFWKKHISHQKSRRLLTKTSDFYTRLGFLSSNFAKNNKHIKNYEELSYHFSALLFIPER